jgi:hypothetical protein
VRHWRRAQLLFPGRGRPRDHQELRRETAVMLDRIRKDWPDAESRPNLIIGV